MGYRIGFRLVGRVVGRVVGETMSLPRGALRHLTPPLPAIKGPAPHPILHSDNSHAQGNSRPNSFCSVILLMIHCVFRKNARSMEDQNFSETYQIKRIQLTFVIFPAPHIGCGSLLRPPTTTGPTARVEAGSLRPSGSCCPL